MQKCDNWNCNTQFSWWKIYKALLNSYKPIRCSECGRIHKITHLGRIMFVAFTILPMLIFGNHLSPFSPIVTFGVAILILIIGSLLTPFLVTYK